MKLSGYLPLLLCLVWCSLLGSLAAAQGPAAAELLPGGEIAWSTDAVGPQRFLAVHGRRSVVMGYPAAGLEVWAYPLQLVNGYQVSFLPGGQTQAIPGASILRRIEYRPDEVVRTYVGDDFVVRERIFVPLDRPGAIFRYEVEGRDDVSVVVQFRPSLNLMWPGALGGQSTRWIDKLSGYLISEPLYGFSAAIASPEVIGHDATANPTIQPSEDGQLKHLVFRPREQTDGTKAAIVFIGYDPPHTPTGSGIIEQLEGHQASLREAAVKHYDDLLAGALQIDTPDAELNRALRWSIVALDQAWVCNELLGCGEVGGYGPSRPGRRPQYDWFFAGDGLVATDALVAAGEYSRAREELAFVTRYQNKANGMIWHELSQSASVVDWSKYPYMYVHVDITFDYLQSFANYVRVSGDKEFLKANWSHIEAAYSYCESLIDPASALPKIPAGQEGGNEQERMGDDLGLSSSWIAAASSFAEMAGTMGSPKSETAERAAYAARHAIARDNWDPAHHFWLAGHTAGGQPIYDQRPNPSGILSQRVFSPRQAAEVLDQIASPDFQTDWGIRSMSSSSSQFDPNSYASGSVSALASSVVANTFWQQHRPLTAWQIWSSLAPWNTLDAEGHIHEVLAGDFYHPQIESVPEQTWSSAGFLRTAVTGLLGLDIESAKLNVKFSPHLPAQWGCLSVGNIRVGTSVLRLQIQRDLTGIEVHIENTGDPVSFTFDPEVPLGAMIEDAVLTNTSQVRSTIQSHTERNDQDQHAIMSFAAARGSTILRVTYNGGVLVGVHSLPPQIGAETSGIKLGAVHLKDHTLTIDTWVKPGKDQTLTLTSEWHVLSVEGGSISQDTPGSYLVRVVIPQSKSQTSGTYIPSRVVIKFQN